MGGYIPDEREEEEPEDFFQVDGYRKGGPPSFSTMLYDVVPPWLFLTIIVVAGAWIPINIWLTSKLDFPQGYGAPCITGRACLVDELLYSPALLHDHTPYELALFVCIWLLPAALLGIVLVRLRTARRTTPSSNSEAE